MENKQYDAIVTKFSEKAGLDYMVLCEDNVYRGAVVCLSARPSKDGSRSEIAVCVTARLEEGSVEIHFRDWNVRGGLNVVIGEFGLVTVEVMTSEFDVNVALRFAKWIKEYGSIAIEVANEVLN